MSTVFSAAANVSPLFSTSPRSLFPSLQFSHTATKFLRNGCHPIRFKSRTQPRITNSLLSDKYPTVGARSTGPIPPTHLIEVVKTAAQTGAQPTSLSWTMIIKYKKWTEHGCLSQNAGSNVRIWVLKVVMEAVNKPRNITYKGLTDLVTETDKMSEAAILEVVKKNFEDHLVLGEEGGIIGDAASDYLWCIDPLDGTTNFAHGYPSFAVSVGVLYRGNPAAAAVVEFVGGPMCWNTRVFSATAGGGAFCNGQRIQVSATNQVERSLLVTGFGYDHDDAWATNIDLFKNFTDVSRGVRRLGAAAVDMCHVALGIVEAYWEYRLKPWDMAAGVLMVEEAGGTVSRMDGGKFCVFDRSVLVSNGLLHAKLLERIGPATEKLKNKGIDFSLWYKPENYRADV